MLCGRYLNLARLTLTVFMILPMVVLLLFADEILITFFKQNSKVSERVSSQDFCSKQQRTIQELCLGSV